jgi:hypothetical protein
MVATIGRNLLISLSFEPNILLNSAIRLEYKVYRIFEVKIS